LPRSFSWITVAINSAISRNVTWKVFNLCCEVLSNGNLLVCGGFIALATLLVAWIQASSSRPHQRRRQRRQGLASCWVRQNLQMDTLEAEKLQGQTNRIPICAKKHCTPTGIPMLLQHNISPTMRPPSSKQNRNKPLRNKPRHLPNHHPAHAPKTRIAYTAHI
jgi:hypothetical protein